MNEQEEEILSKVLMDLNFFLENRSVPLVCMSVRRYFCTILIHERFLYLRSQK